MINKYLLRNSFLEQQLFSEASNQLNMLIVIPARNEPKLLETLESLMRAKQPQKAYEVIVVFNHPEGDSEELKKANISYLKECRRWIKENQYKHIHCIEAMDLPDKFAGVGLARKIGMDEALRRLDTNKNGIIVALDSDCTVAKNYLKAIENHFDTFPNCNGVSIYFEHPLDEMNEHLLEGIIQYELHLRYYNQLLVYAGHPYAFHTVGSSMAVRAEAYIKQGGMNKRKAGEDFYFLQKIIQLGNFKEIKNTCVYPSARVSDRVPFGTGRAMGEWINKEKLVFDSYHPEAGEELKRFFKLVEKQASSLSYDELPKSVANFIGEAAWNDKMNEITRNTKTKDAFLQRFYAWFNLFMCFKYVHFYRDNYQSNIPIREAAIELLSKLENNPSTELTDRELLNKFREWEG